MANMESVVRPLSEKEHRLLSAVLKNRQRRLASFSRRQLTALAVVCGGLWGLTMVVAFKAKGPFLIPTMVWVSLATAFYIWSHFTEKPKLRAEASRYEWAVARSEARVVHIQSDEMVEFEEEEDEGACYAFRVGHNRIVFIRGQDFYSSAKFPNNDFSLVHIHDANGSPLETFVEKTGTKLKPVRQIPATLKSKMRIPDHLQVIDGSLDHLEQLLARKNAL